jgi:hypothetical protein
MTSEYVHYINISINLLNWERNETFQFRSRDELVDWSELHPAENPVPPSSYRLHVHFLIICQYVAWIVCEFLHGLDNWYDIITP